MLSKIAAAAVCLLMFCSCGAASLLGTESLLEAPKLNKRQTEVSRALESILSLRSIVYKYPQSGEYRSSFIFFDFDGDGRDEAIVFYAYTGDAAGAVRAKILRQREDDTWFPFYDISSQSVGVNFVQFEKLLDKDAYCMVIGWQGEGRQSSTLEIYSQRDGGFPIEASCSYVDYSIEDFNGDGLAEIVVISREGSGNSFRASLLQARGNRMETVHWLELAPEAESVLALTTGRLWDGGLAVYIDEAVSGGPVFMLATEIIRVASGRMELLCGGGEQDSAARGSYDMTFRDEDIMSMDFDSDGYVEVPRPATLPGPGGISAADAPRLIEFMGFGPGGFTLQSAAVINRQAGYLVYFPDRWKENVTVERERENDEWSFRKWNPDALEPSEELLRVRVSYGGDYLDMFENYTELDSKGATIYAAYIPPIPGEPLAVAEAEVKRMFRLLPGT